MMGLSDTRPRAGAAKLWALPCAALVLASAAGCGDDVPDEPTWAEDVRPILIANCASCHSFPPIGAAPGPGSFGDGFRLDVYGDTILDDGTEYLGNDVGGRVVPGAAELSDRIVARAVEDETMPPPFPGTTSKRPLRSRQQEILERWHEQGAQRGPPAPGNRPPTMELLRPLDESRDGEVLVIEYEIRDPDFDYVTGDLRAFVDDGDGVVVTRALHSGRGQVHWNASDFEGEEIDLVATLDDGSETVDIELGAVEID